MVEKTTSRVMAADRTFGEFSDFLQCQSGIFWIPPHKCHHSALKSVIILY
jgi:hypothetical protein